MTAEPATEPVTSRPVADRFDFISPAIETTLAEYDTTHSPNRYAALPATELESLSPGRISAVPKPKRVLRSLPPAATLTADNTPPASARQATSPQVAGWRMIRTIKTKELPEEALGGSDLLPELPGKKPEVSLPASPPESKISRRVRSRPTVARPNPTKPPQAPSGALADEPWKNRALFRDY